MTRKSRDSAKSSAPKSAATPSPSAPTGLPVKISHQRRIQIVTALGGYYPRGQHQGARGERATMRNWNPREQDADADNLGDLSVLRGRSYDAARSQPLAAGAILTQRRNVLGTGLIPQSRVNIARLNLEKSVADEWQQNSDDLWWFHANSTAIDASGRRTFAVLQNLAFASVLLGGDVLLVRQWKPRVGRYSTCIQLYEAHRICTPPDEVESATLRHGVQMDPHGEPIGFWVRNDTSPTLLASRSNYTYEPARDNMGGLRAILISDPQRPGETRGVPYLSPVLERLRGLSEYMDNEILASVLQSLLTFFLETPDAGLGEDPGLGTLLSADHTKAATGQDDTREISLGKGALVEGLPGEKLHMQQPTRPNATVQAFFEAAATEMAPALGISKGVILKHFDKSYSASRGELQESNRDYLARRDPIISQLCEPVRDWWLEEAVALAADPNADPHMVIAAPGFLESRVIRAAWSYCDWAGPVLTSLDPRKEVDAMRVAIDTGLMSRQTAAARLYGLDAAVEHEQLVTEHIARSKVGLDEVPDFASSSRSTSTSVAVEPSGEDLDEQDKKDQRDNEGEEDE